MKAQTQIIDGYWGLLSNLNPDLKLKLIERLSKSIHQDLTARRNKFEKSFGAWKDSKDAEEIISEIRNARNFNREIESF
ncbi:hypothetical protein LX69_00958 [Breznakibacter xylanolyticus]|uniref:Uncharacterized protein n=1 Tax=Breznakibacter xylanolyticus TaxID=990 RepID=A0A2W7QBY9_9BACT|nr:hypothetical protein [Breznakibacter xylanolyticus]PZX19289.1 hypothetical protein LX69_00958 [Breznakibacter xylanolyticus]